MSLHHLLRAEKQRILSAWEAITGSLWGAQHQAGPLLREQMQEFLDWLEERLQSRSGSPSFPHERALQHAAERVRAGYDLAEVISDYAVLRDCILEVWEAQPEAVQSASEVRGVNQAIDEVVAYVAVLYARLRLFRDDRPREEGELVTPH
jgi:hypothetical protein